MLTTHIYISWQSQMTAVLLSISLRNVCKTSELGHLKIYQCSTMAKQRSHIHSNFTKNCPTCLDINVGNVTITPKTEVCDLGVIIDKHLSLTSQINSACKSAFYALHNIRKIRKYLDSHSTERLIHAFIPSRIDNCKSLFCVLPVVETALLVYKALNGMSPTYIKKKPYCSIYSCP